MIRRRHPIRRSLPWLLALAIIGGVAHRLQLALAQTDTDIVERANAVRLGDPDNGIPKDPRSALQYLEPLLEREPDHFQGLIQAARAWADLRNFDKAVEFLEQAASTATTDGQRVAALRMAVNYLINEDRYDEAIDRARQVRDIQPENPVLPLQLGAAQYKGSTSAQRDALRPFIGADKGSVEIEIERRVEEFVTDIWGEPQVEPLVDFLAPDADNAFREELRTNLVAARARFLQASESMADYRIFDGFDAGVAQAYTEVLLRSGRLFEAWIESALALRHGTSNITVKQSMLEIQALCAMAISEHGLAADRYEAIVDLWVAKRGDWAPPRFLSSLIEERLADEDWEWILANDRRMAELTDNDVYPRFAMATALFRSGRLQEALEQIKDPYQLISLSAMMPNSVRGFPDRRHQILKTSYEIFAATSEFSVEGDLDSGALDSLLLLFPEDLEARRQRIAIARQQGSFEAAMQDAFELLTRNRRDADDFDLWLACAEQLSQQRHGRSLAERAHGRVHSERTLRRAALQAAFESSKVRRRTGRTDELRPGSNQSFPAQDPALAFAVVQERIERNDLEHARNDARQLLQAHPQIQEFRYRLARLLVREGKLEAAVEDFLQLLDDVPGDTEALDLALRVEVALGHDEQAADLVNTMILQNPKGVGAVRYASQQLAHHRATQAERTLERIIAAAGGKPSIDVLIMLARTRLAAGKLDQAAALVAGLTGLGRNTEDIALLGLELGLAQHQSNLVESAVRILRPLAAGLFPDQIELLCGRLLEAQMYAELLEAFPEEDRQLPALRPALIPLAEAAKGIGQVETADALLQTADTTDGLRDRFILLALDGRTAEANRRLNLLSVRDAQLADRDLCLAAAAALTGTRTLLDDVPTAYLRRLGLAEEFEPARIELLDALLRILPAMTRLDTIRPAELLDDPHGTYPHAGGDVERFLAVAREDPERARRAGESLILLLLASDRPFWQRESLFLAEHALSLVPGLTTASVRVAEAELAAGRSREALELLAGFLSAGEIDRHGIELFLAATEAFGKEEWGLGLALALARRDDRIHLLLARTLVARGYPKEARTLYEQFLERHPDDPEALGGLIENLAILRAQRDLLETVETTLASHPDNSALTALCANALAGLTSPQPKAVALMERLADAVPEEFRLLATLARAHEGDSEQVQAILRRMLDTMAAQPVPMGSPEASTRTRMLLEGAAAARHSGLLDLAREVHMRGMRLDPGNIMMYREMAFLELEEGHLDRARRYLDVLAFVNRSDKEPPLALARLLFEQVGQPHLAADVIRAAYATSMPPSAVEILAAETFLRGHTSEALALFHSLRNNPMVTPDTILNIGRMAYASRHDDVAKVMFDLFLTTAAKDHPSRQRTEGLVQSLEPQAAEAAAPGARRRGGARPAKTARKRPSQGSDATLAQAADGG